MYKYLKIVNIKKLKWLFFGWYTQEQVIKLNFKLQEKLASRKNITGCNKMTHSLTDQVCDLNDPWSASYRFCSDWEKLIWL